MNTTIKNYYEGFEGYPEIQFIRIAEDGSRQILRMWEGYFDFIMDLIHPQKDGWVGLSYYYHLVIGWYDESPWQIKDVGTVINEFKEIDTSTLNTQTQNVYRDILELLTSLSTNETVWINYD